MNGLSKNERRVNVHAVTDVKSMVDLEVETLSISTLHLQKKQNSIH